MGSDNSFGLTDKGYDRAEINIDQDQLTKRCINGAPHLRRRVRRDWAQFCRRDATAQRDRPHQPNDLFGIKIDGAALHLCPRAAGLATASTSNTRSRLRRQRPARWRWRCSAIVCASGQGWERAMSLEHWHRRPGRDARWRPRTDQWSYPAALGKCRLRASAMTRSEKQSTSRARGGPLMQVLSRIESHARPSCYKHDAFRGRQRTSRQQCKWRCATAASCEIAARFLRAAEKISSFGEGGLS